MFSTIRRCFIVALGIILQLGSAIVIQLIFGEQVAIVNLIVEVISVLIVLQILKNSVRLSNDLPWIILILLFPVFGIILLLTVGRNFTKNQLLKNIFLTEQQYQKYFRQDPRVKRQIAADQLDNLQYILNRTPYPITTNNQITYYEIGEKLYPDLLQALKKAQKFIFLEYFIIKSGVMWNSILEILKAKAAAGVDVRILYDDVGNLTLFSTNYPAKLASYGIKCIPFNTLSPFKGIFMNNRDHRKMAIIDGEVAFSGGINLGDEYINLDHRLGVWKDNGIRIVGDAVWNFTIMFLTMWNANRQTDHNLRKFQHRFPKPATQSERGFVVPYGITPLGKDPIGEDIYINLINSAKTYLYIMTPYLIIDTDLINSLIRAVKRGVDLRIIVPGVPDKKLVYTQTTSFFKLLHDHGIKIYRYDPGFIHSKVFLSDDVRAVVGTINLDYRSLYLHFENGVYLEQVPALRAIKSDFTHTFKKCHQLQAADVKVGLLKNIWQSILRLFAPMF